MTFEGLFWTVVSALIGLGVTFYFYKRAANDLKDEAKNLKVEAEKLRRLSELIIYKLQHPEANIDIRVDEEGRVSGYIVSAVGRA